MVSVSISIQFTSCVIGDLAHHEVMKSIVSSSIGTRRNSCVMEGRASEFMQLIKTNI
jgi:hypothetical protein